MLWEIISGARRGVIAGERQRAAALCASELASIAYEADAQVRAAQAVITADRKP